MHASLVRCAGAAWAILVALSSPAFAQFDECDNTIYKMWVIDCDGCFTGTAGVWQPYGNFFPLCRQENNPDHYDQAAISLTNHYRQYCPSVTFRRGGLNTPPSGNPCGGGGGGGGGDGGLLDFLLSLFGGLGGLIAFLISLIFGWRVGAG